MGGCFPHIQIADYDSFMTESVAKSIQRVDIGEIVELAVRVPGVAINREDFLRAAFDSEVTEDQLNALLRSSPVEAGISKKTIERVAANSISHETAVVTALSTAAGLPGGWFALGTVPMDLAQYFAATFRISQKLAYIHGWPEMFESGTKNISDETKNLLVLFLGAMFGVQAANAGLAKLSLAIATNVATKLPQKALTKTVLYPIVKQVFKAVGAKMTKTIYASGVSKLIPLAGAVVSGGITLFSFFPLANRLNKHLSSLQARKQRAIKRAAPRVAAQ